MVVSKKSFIGTNSLDSTTPKIEFLVFNSPVNMQLLAISFWINKRIHVSFSGISCTHFTGCIIVFENSNLGFLCVNVQRVWVLKESQGYFEEMRAKYSKTGKIALHGIS